MQNAIIRLNTMSSKLIPNHVFSKLQVAILPLNRVIKF